ncbi:hypothetical protein LINPERHAP1_LOCUS30677 [Linum perenne]
MVLWSLTKTEVFTVKSLNLQLRSVKFPGLDDFPASTIWNKVVPVKVQGFLWLVFHGRILTLDVLQAKGFHLPNRCSLCCSQGEWVNHLFIHCPFVHSIWSKISSRLSIFGPLPASSSSLILGWKGLNCDSTHSPLRKVLLHSILWQIWLERNDVIFRDSVASASRVFFRVLASCYRWLKVHAVISQHDFELWMRQLAAT